MPLVNHPKWINWSINQSINQLIHQSINQSLPCFAVVLSFSRPPRRNESTKNFVSPNIPAWPPITEKRWFRLFTTPPFIKKSWKILRKQRPSDNWWKLHRRYWTSITGAWINTVNPPPTDRMTLSLSQIAPPFHPIPHGGEKPKTKSAKYPVSWIRINEAKPTFPP